MLDKQTQIQGSGCLQPKKGMSRNMDPEKGTQGFQVYLRCFVSEIQQYQQTSRASGKNLQI